MEASALSGWRPGHDPHDDMPPSIPLPPGATFAGGNPMATAFPGFTGASPHGGNSHPNLPALDADGWPMHHHSPLPANPYENWPHLHGWPGHGHPHPTPASHHAPLPGWPAPSWHGYSPWHGQSHIPLAGPSQHHTPAWGSYSPWPGGFGRVDDTARGRQPGEANWFALGAERSRRAKSHSRRKKSKSPHPHPAFPGFGGGGAGYFHDEPEEYEDSDDDEGYFGHGKTNWDMLDGKFRGLSVGRGHGHGTPQTKKRSLSFNGGHHGRPLVYRQRSISNPIYQAYHITYEQHMQQHGYGAAKGDDLPYRPSSWRSDYSVKGGMMHTLEVGLGLKRSNSDVKEINDNHKRSLHPHLLYTGTSPIPSISLDLRLNPSIPNSISRFLNLLSLPQNPHGVSSVDLLQFATHPPCTTMRLFHKRLPWYIDIDVSNRLENTWITVQDIISSLFLTLTGHGLGGRSQVSAAEYWCGEMGDHVEASTPPPPAPGALPPVGGGGTPLLRGLSTPLPGLALLGGGGDHKKSKHTAREQVSMSWMIRGRLAHHIAYAAGKQQGDPEAIALEEAARAEQSERARGVRRVDWLAIGTNVDDQRAFRWIGLKKGRRGMWEIVTEV